MDVDALRDVSREVGIPVQPSPDTVEIIQACPFVITSFEILFAFLRTSIDRKCISSPTAYQWLTFVMSRMWRRSNASVMSDCL